MVVGARSAIFSPIENLGIIIIDEEHEQSYISESNPRYDTHEIAEFRRKYNDCILVLGSATPSIDSYLKALEGEFQLVEMPVRVNGLEMPKIVIVDMLNELRHGNSEIFSIPLIAELGNVVEKKKQAMIFINRRGFSSFQRCRECGYVAKCKDCDVSLVYHRYENKLKCHYCGKRYRALDICPSCGSHNIKQGAIGTERVVEELKKYFPDVPIFRMDNDTTSTKGAHRSILSQFREAKPGILVGTQMVTKGLDFDGVSVVGIVNADNMINFPDFRAHERAFDMIEQVAGRAGRKHKQGIVCIQTSEPRHPIIQYAVAHDYLGFIKNELEERRHFGYPPFTRIINIYIKHRDDNSLTEMSVRFSNMLREVFGRRVLGPETPVVARIQRLYIRQIVLKMETSASMPKVKQILRTIYEQSLSDPRMKSAIVYYDVDPV